MIVVLIAFFFGRSIRCEYGDRIISRVLLAIVLIIEVIYVRAMQ